MKIADFRFVGKLDIEEVEKDLEFWISRKMYGQLWKEDGQQKGLLVPTYYATDLASVPKRLRWLVHPLDADVRKGAVPHDRAYETHEITRARADALLYYSMLHRNAPFRRAWLVYAAVRLGGAHAYETGPKRRDERQAYAIHLLGSPVY